MAFPSGVFGPFDLAPFLRLAMARLESLFAFGSSITHTPSMALLAMENSY
jgi:hypothetical protein